MSLETRIYQKGERLKLVSLLGTSLRDMYKGRFLAKQLAVRDIKSKYRKSVLGVFWDLIAPLSTALVWIFLRSSGTVALDETGVPYPLFAFTGTLLWAILVESINMPLRSTQGAKGIMSKINFPKEALILSGFYKLLFNSSFKILLLIFFFIFFKVSPSGSALLFPLTVVGLILAGVTFGLFITPFGMLYNDVSRAISMSFQFIMYVTPVVYAIPQEGIMKTIMEYNPLTPLILVNRHVLLGLEVPHLTYFFVIMAALLPLFAVALVLYRISIPIIVERN